MNTNYDILIQQHRSSCQRRSSEPTITLQSGVSESNINERVSRPDAIAVSSDDYDWDHHQHLHLHQNQNQNQNQNQRQNQQPNGQSRQHLQTPTSDQFNTASDEGHIDDTNSGNLSLSHLSIHEMNRHDSQTLARKNKVLHDSNGRTAPSNATTTTNTGASSKRFKQEDELVSAMCRSHQSQLAHRRSSLSSSCSSNSQSRSSSSLRLLQNTNVHNKMQLERQKHPTDRERRKRERKVQKDAAKTAATYYGECYLEGVGMSHADKAARDSHTKYKKWWLQEIQDCNYNSSMGDGVSVPIYNSPPRESTIAGAEMIMDETRGNACSLNGPDENTEEIKSGRLRSSSISQYYVVDDTEYDTPIGGPALMAAAATHPKSRLGPGSESQSFGNDVGALLSANRLGGFDRSSGACHPSPSLHERIPQPQPRPQTRMQTQLMDINVNRRTNKRQRPVVATADANNVNRTVMRQSDLKRSQTCYGVVDPYATTDDEITIPVAPLRPQARSQLAFERERAKRIECNRRDSSYSDYDLEKSYHSNNQQRRSYQNWDQNQEQVFTRKSSFYHNVHKRNVTREQMLYLQRHHSIQEEIKDQHDGYPQNDDYNSQDDGSPLNTLFSPQMNLEPDHHAKDINNAKLDLIRALAVSDGDVTGKRFLHALEQLRSFYLQTNYDARLAHSSPSEDRYLEGNWLTISRPHFTECIGMNSSGEYMYTLGRMSFDMFSPGNLICSILGIFNSIEIVNIERDIDTLKSIPRSLKEEVKRGDSILRRYNIITAFKIEPDSPLFGSRSPNKNVQKGLRGTITTYGYVLPDPEKPNRLSIWFSSGTIEPNIDNFKKEQWKKVFGGGFMKRHLQERARILAAKLLLGAQVPSKMEEDGSMEFFLSRPIGGHGTAYVDVLYLDDNLRIVQGHRGSLFVFTKVDSRSVSNGIE